MKGYGLPRNHDIDGPDVADIHNYGLKGSAGHIPGPGGDIRSNFKNPDAKAARRRSFKRKAREEGKKECHLDD